MTFGILDFTSNELPTVLELARKGNAAKFDQIFRGAELPMQGDCVDPQWVCDWNRKGKLNCDSKFRPAFEKFLGDGAMQKAQLKLAIRQYLSRISRYRSLGLRTQYGLVAMAVVANNLKSKPECRPATWKQKCSGEGDEGAVVDCMLHEYAENACRHDLSGSRGRANLIKSIFSGHKSDRYEEPDADRIASCSSKWGGRGD